MQLSWVVKCVHNLGTTSWWKAKAETVFKKTNATSVLGDVLSPNHGCVCKNNLVFFVNKGFWWKYFLVKLIQRVPKVSSVQENDQTHSGHRVERKFGHTCLSTGLQCSKHSRLIHDSQSNIPSETNPNPTFIVPLWNYAIPEFRFNTLVWIWLV